MAARNKLTESFALVTVTVVERLQYLGTRNLFRFSIRFLDDPDAGCTSEPLRHSVNTSAAATQGARGS